MSELLGHFPSDCYLSYGGSIARIAVLFYMPDYHCAKLALVHPSKSGRSFVMANLYHLGVETRSICRSTEITADSRKLP